MPHKDAKNRAAVLDYLKSETLRKPARLDELVTDTYANTDHPGMATDSIQGQFLGFLIRSINAKRILEVGTFTGVGALWMADAAGPDGKVVACDLSEEYTTLGRPHWVEAGLADRIDLRLAPALETLQQLLDSPEDGPGSFDFCYIDADKESYPAYYEAVLQLLRPGGIIALDNMLLGGRVLQSEAPDEATVQVRKLTTALLSDTRVDISHLPIGDGLYLARKR